jgi:glutamate/aspartate transport system permease protein
MQIDLSFFSWQLIQTYVLNGLQFSLQLTVLATAGGMFIGTLLALCRLSGKPLLAWPAAVYVNVMRSVPLVMVLLWFFLLLPFLLGRSIGAEVSALITFTVFQSAFFCEIIRSGIQAIPRGQIDAGYALGLGYAQNMRLVILPQALRNMTPVLMTQTIILFQDTSLVYAIGAYDLLKGFEIAGKNMGRPVEAYLAAAIFYLLICLGLSQLVRRLQMQRPTAT